MTSKNKIDQAQLAESIAEAEDVINEIGKGILLLGKARDGAEIDPGVLNSVFRAAHTLKGMAGMIGLADIAELSHALEDKLDNLRLGRTRLDDDAIGAMISAHGMLTKMLSARGSKDFSEEITPIKDSLGTINAEPRTDAPEIDKTLLGMLTEYEAHRLKENIASARNIFIVGFRFPIATFDKDFTASTSAISGVAELIATLPSNSSTSEALFFDLLVGTKKSRDDLKAVVDGACLVGIRELMAEAVLEPVGASWTGDDARATEEKRRDAALRESIPTLRRVGDIVRVNINKLDVIMSIINEIAILRSGVDHIGEALKRSPDFAAMGLELKRTGKNMERKIAELRDSVLSVRMVRIGSLFERYETVVDKLARDSGKMLKLVTNGAETEIDKLVVEELADPLMHLVRNAADHAIESPETRMSLSKPVDGLIMLSARHKGNHVVVEVRDDGAGMDIAAIKARAVKIGLYPMAYVDSLTRAEALDIIFVPGFSIRDTISETSGRGVGLDVVKENIMRLGGAVAIDTRKGLGTTFTLTVPSTLAVVQALIIEDCGVRYAVALNAVAEIMHLSPEKTRNVALSGGLDYGGRSVPSVRLTEFFGKTVPLAHAGGMKYGIVAGIAESRVCLVVDRLVEEMDVVIKPLSSLIKTVGIAGATDMGEYGTMLVIDPNGIIEKVNNERKLSRM